MTERPASPWLLAVASATLAVALGGAWMLGSRLDAVERAMEKRAASTAAATSPTPPGKRGAKEKPAADLDERIEQVRTEAYEYYSEVKSDLYQLQTTLRRVDSMLKNIARAMVKPGEPWGSSGLAAVMEVLPAATIDAYRRDAESIGVRVSPGRVEVRGFLNMSPDRAYPIEFFLTRWPESGHETLLHAVGNRDLGPESSSESLRGLVTSIYKGLVAAGFHEGHPGGWVEVAASGDAAPPDEVDTEDVAPPGPPPSTTPTPTPPSGRAKRPKMRWVPPEGDRVYLGVRYRLGGKVHLARATDWVIDPDARAVLPEDCLRFTGSLRVEDVSSGDEILSAEASGNVVSVDQNPNSLVEILGPEGRHVSNDLQYNWTRIPKPGAILQLEDGRSHLYGHVNPREGTVTVVRLETDGVEILMTEPPVLLVDSRGAGDDEGEGESGDGMGGEKEGPTPAKVVPFVPLEGTPGAFTLRDGAVRSAGGWDGAVRIRVNVAGKALRTVRVTPLYLDFVFSKTPIVPEGDGAAPMQPVGEILDGPKGTGETRR